MLTNYHDNIYCYMLHTINLLPLIELINYNPGILHCTFILPVYSSESPCERLFQFAIFSNPTLFMLRIIGEVEGQ